jgi:NAD+ synthase (glutamine-hydrolysing)
VLLALGQFNPVIGDLDGNVARMREQIGQARAAGAQMVLFPELAVSGYPPEDLLLRSDFLEACRAAVDALAREAQGIVVAVGAPLHGPSDLHNALVLAAGGEVRAVYHKVELPHYGVFDEGRYFGPGSGQALVRVGGHLVALTLCADLWIADGPAAGAARAGAELILNASASPFHVGKHRERETLLFQRARDMVCPIAYCNLWGGQDELVFDGGSLVVDHGGTIVARAGQFRDELLCCSLNLRAVRSARLRDPRLRAVGAPEPAGPSPAAARTTLAEIDLPAQRTAPAPSRLQPLLGEREELWQAVCTGIADYARKTGFEHAMVGLDGGVASALVVLLACDALGAARISCVVMPSADSDAAAATNACDLARALGCDLRVVATDALDAAYSEALDPELADGERARTRERIRARIRSNVLMALASSHGWLHLSTGTKSELACGYATLYGETFGGFAAIKDLPRTLVTELVLWRMKAFGAPVPDAIQAEPDAGMYHSQWVLDGLPSFDVVDPIIQLYAEDDEDPETIVARGYDAALVRRVVALVEGAEYKRRQTPPGITISPRAFGRGRRMPINHRFAADATATEAPRSATPAAS